MLAHLNHVSLQGSACCVFLVFTEHTVQRQGLKQSFQKQELTLKTHMSITYENVGFLLSLFWGGGILLILFLVFVVERTGCLTS